MSTFRVGHGYDVHKLAEGLPLILGGVQIAHTKGCVAHSDGDVLTHALCDALLGAAALGDIGSHFPDTSNEYKGINSMILLERCVELLSQRGYSVVNVDTTLALQAPKVRQYIDSMRAEIAKVMRLDLDCVSVKATTTEQLGFVGRQEGVSAYASVLIEKL